MGLDRRQEKALSTEPAMGSVVWVAQQSLCHVRDLVPVVIESYFSGKSRSWAACIKLLRVVTFKSTLTEAQFSGMRRNTLRRLILFPDLTFHCLSKSNLMSLQSSSVYTELISSSVWDAQTVCLWLPLLHLFFLYLNLRFSGNSSFLLCAAFSTVDLY